jgi:hypothetical protein
LIVGLSGQTGSSRTIFRTALFDPNRKLSNLD